MSDIPLFPESHNGVPARLKGEAATRKGEYLGLKTKAPEPRGEDVPVLPPDMSRAAFNLAMQELKDNIGASNVVLNDKPLDNGWYGKPSPLSSP